MTDVAIRCEGLAKQYRIGERESYKALRDVITDAFASPFRRLRSALRHSSNSSAGSEKPNIWALKDVSFEIKCGEVVGIIGRNGAGKSTLLKILSRITEPTDGHADIWGRVGSLLEVGTGFHPELTGRDNIFLNGAILGMRRAEIVRKFDEIVDFAEVEKFIDTPVKHYSSGMYVRLAFAVAAYLEPEILLVDEVLAVGDAQFQKKCLGKMSDASRYGRTVLLVSHNMAVVNQLCPRTILFSNGNIELDGRTSDVIATYLRAGSDSAGEHVWDDPKRAPGNDNVRLRSIRVLARGQTSAETYIDEEVSIEVEFWNFRHNIRNLGVVIYLLDSMGNIVLSTVSTPAANSLPEEWFQKAHPAGLYRTTCTLPANFLNDGLYSITVYGVTFGPLSIEMEAPQVLSFSVFDTGSMREAGGGERWHGVVRVRFPWRTEYLGGDSNGSVGGQRAILEGGGEIWPCR
jgi:lipopolysaccharide transport system ATP-binding protein